MAIRPRDGPLRVVVAVIASRVVGPVSNVITYVYTGAVEG